MKVLEAFELYRFYHADEDETLALKGINLDIEFGEMLAVIGPSGSGKSTLLRCLSGIDDPDGGYVLFLGKRISHKPENMRCRMRFEYMGIMLQNDNLLNHLSVRENIVFAAYTHKMAKCEQIADNLIDELDLRHCANNTVYNISGGEYARTSLAVAMSTNPKILFLDEPTSEVDKETEGIILEILNKYRKNKGAVIVVTHSDAVATYADKTAHIFDGQVTYE
jgi:putative ABC transport system ATP-binding protein